MDDPGKDGQSQKSHEPRDGLASPGEHEGSDGREQRPNDDGAGVLKAPQTPLEDEGKEEDEQQLAEPEEMILFGVKEMTQAEGGDDGIGKREEAGEHERAGVAAPGLAFCRR